MSGSPSSCGICDIRHISKPSDVWCSDCEEGLCTECLEHHSLAKPSRNHTTIPISEYRKLPSYVLEINEHCNEHHEKCIAYCKEHERPCCRICILENHKTCNNVTILENIIKNVKTSNLFSEIERLIDELIETIGKIRQNREKNTSAVKEQKMLVESEILELRKKIDKHLDKLQESLMKELTEKRERNNRTNTRTIGNFRRETERNDRTPDKYSQHKKVCIRPTNIYSRQANRERRRNTRLVSTVNS